LTNEKADTTEIDSYTYTYDNANNRISVVDSKGTTYYTYDSLNRLISVTEPSGKVTAYAFDKAGKASLYTKS
jgi:YD repeat-containing protein